MITSLRMGSTGAKVKALQEALNRSGSRLKVDGHFGRATDLAVRGFQRRRGLLPDGLVGARTLKALGITDGHTGGAPVSGRSSGSTPTFHDYLKDLLNRIGPFIYPHAKAAQTEKPPEIPAKPAGALSLSPAGYDFLFKLEAMKGVSNHLYWPKGASGVTLGAGYDMKERSSEVVKANLLSLGLVAEIAEKAAKGAGLTGDAADKFAKDNKKLISLTPEQETRFLHMTVPPYEAKVRSHVHVNLLQHEFDALVSFTYNPGAQFHNVTKFINEGKVADAMAHIKKVITSKGEVLATLVKRREKEVSLYLYGKYH